MITISSAVLENDGKIIFYDQSNWIKKILCSTLRKPTNTGSRQKHVLINAIILTNSAIFLTGKTRGYELRIKLFFTKYSQSDTDELVCHYYNGIYTDVKTATGNTIITVG